MNSADKDTNNNPQNTVFLHKTLIWKISFWLRYQKYGYQELF